MKNMKAYFYLLAMFVIAVIYYPDPVSPDSWWVKWAAMLFFGSAFISYETFKKYGWDAAALIFYICVNAILIIACNHGQYSEYSDRTQFIIHKFVSLGLICFIALIYLVHKIESLYIERIFGILCLANSVFVIAQSIFNENILNRGGFLNNASINACFIAFTIPLIFRMRGRFLLLLPLPIAAIFLSRASVPVGVLSVMTFVWLTLNIKRSWISIITLSLAILIPGIFLYVGHALDPKHFFSSSDRFQMYQMVWEAMTAKNNLWIGQGLSTFAVYGPVIQLQNNFNLGYWYIFLHNDFMQIFFELGAIGFGLFVLVVISGLTNLIRRKDRVILLCGVGYLATMLFNYPLHLSLTAFFGLYIAKEALIKNPCQDI